MAATCSVWARPGAAVTIEPAAQLELSAGPFENLIDAKRVFLEFEDDAYQALSPIGGRGRLRLVSTR